MRRRSFIKSAGVSGSVGLGMAMAGCTQQSSGQTSTSGQTTGSTKSSNSGGSSGASQSLTIGSVFSSGSFINTMAKKWAADVKKQTSGSVDITIQAGAGGETDLIKQASIGSLDGTIIGALWVSKYTPKYYWVESPFVFKTWDQQKKAYMSKYLDEARTNFKNKANQQVVGQPIYRGYRNVSGNKPFKKPSDIKGVKIRVPQTSAWVKIWKGIGANPATVSFNELYSALQQGVVAAQENPAHTMLAKSLYQVQDYYTLTHHLTSTGWVTMNNGSLSKLDKSTRQTVLNSLTNTIKTTNKNTQQNEKQTLSELKKKGMKVVDADQQAWRKAAQPTIKQMFQSGKWQPSLKKVQNI